MNARLCTICARGGSKGLKNKNIKDFLGKPLIAHTIEIAKESGLFHAIAISSDSDEILTTAKAWGADFVIQRPHELATDTAAKLPAIQHCAKAVQALTAEQFNTFVDLSVTSPLMLPKDIRGAVKLLEEGDAINVVTASLAKHSPYFSLLEPKQDGYAELVKKTGQFTCRQDLPPCYGMNGAIYVWAGKTFFDLNEIITDKTLIYEMPQIRSVDIDSELDFTIAALLFSKRETALTEASAE